MNIRSSTKKLHTSYRKGYSTAMALRYRTTELRQRVIVITGSKGVATVGEYMAAILRANGDDVAVVSSRETGFRRTLRDVYIQLARLKKTQARYILIELTPSLLTALMHSRVAIDTVVVSAWNECAHQAVDMLQYERLVRPYETEDGEPRVVSEHNLMTFGHDPGADMAIESHTQFKKGTEAVIRVDHHDTLHIATYLIGVHNIEWACVALCAAYLIGIPTDVLADGIADVEQVAGNYEQSFQDSYTIVRDTTDGPGVLLQVVQTARELTSRRVLVAIDHELDEEIYHTLKPYVDRMVVVGRSYGINGVETAAFASEAQDIVLRAARKSDTVVLIGESYRIAAQTEGESHESTK